MDIALNVGSLLVGAWITWAVSRWYYIKAGGDLEKEAKALRKQTDLVIYCLTNPGTKVTAERDADGNFGSLIVSGIGAATGSSSATAATKHPRR